MPSIARRSAPLALACLLLAACATGPSPQEVERRQAAASAAASLIAEGRAVEGGEAYMRLVESLPEAAAAPYRLAAAEAYLGADRLDLARLAAGNLPPTLGDPTLDARAGLVRGRIALAEDRPAEVLAALPASALGALPATSLATAREVRARAYAAVGNPLEAARERVELELLLTDEAALASNRQALWEGLRQLSPLALGAARTPPPDTLGGWVALAEIAVTGAEDRSRMPERLAQWRLAYAGHPASTEILPALLGESRLSAGPPERIALLLPLTGRFEAAARAVRDGFMAARLVDSGSGRTPAVDVVDTGSGDAAVLYRRAVEAGAGMVIGPLEKSAVAAVAALGELPVPTIALNQLGGDGEASVEAPTWMFQFALSPEGEASAVADRAFAEGYRHAGVIAPEGEWGSRVDSAFAEHWSALGGRTVARARYDADARDLSGPVKALLGIDASERRAKELVAALGRRVEHQPRHRQDLDFVFMAAFPRQARQIQPHMRFFGAEEIPIWATSHIYIGQPDPQSDLDVEGVVIGDMPWVLAPDQVPDDLARRVNESFPESLSPLGRLYAFGVDAYRLVTRLGQLYGDPAAEVPGATGWLRLAPGRIVMRRLAFARFAEGQLRPLGDAPPR